MWHSAVYLSQSLPSVSFGTSLPGLLPLLDCLPLHASILTSDDAQVGIVFQPPDAIVHCRRFSKVDVASNNRPFSLFCYFSILAYCKSRPAMSFVAPCCTEPACCKPWLIGDAGCNFLWTHEMPTMFSGFAFSTGDCTSLPSRKFLNVLSVGTDWRCSSKPQTLVMLGQTFLRPVRVSHYFL